MRMQVIEDYCIDRGDFKERLSKFMNAVQPLSAICAHVMLCHVGLCHVMVCVCVCVCLCVCVCVCLRTCVRGWLWLTSVQCNRRGQLPHPLSFLCRTRRAANTTKRGDDYDNNDDDTGADSDDNGNAKEQQ